MDALWIDALLESTESLQSPRASPLGRVSTYQSPEMIAIAFAENKKAQMASKAMFQLVHTHGDILREVIFVFLFAGKSTLGMEIRLGRYIASVPCSSFA